jgi:hypothetical protein
MARVERDHRQILAKIEGIARLSVRGGKQAVKEWRIIRNPSIVSAFDLVIADSDYERE